MCFQFSGLQLPTFFIFLSEINILSWWCSHQTSVFLYLYIQQLMQEPLTG